MSDQHPPQDPFELLKRMWAPMSLPLPGMVAPIADTGEIDKRIADLKSVENWLTLNLNVVKMSVQGLEMQKATLSTLQAAQQAVARSPLPSSEPRAEGSGSAQNPMEAWWNMLQQAPTPTPGGKKGR
jgi:hypothetical protein